MRKAVDQVRPPAAALEAIEPGQRVLLPDRCSQRRRAGAPADDRGSGSVRCSLLVADPPKLELRLWLRDWLALFRLSRRWILHLRREDFGRLVDRPSQQCRSSYEQRRAHGT